MHQESASESTNVNHTMSQPPLEPDEKALKDWEKMPKGKPSPEALPPATGGVPSWLWAAVIVLLVVIVIGLVSQ